MDKVKVSVIVPAFNAAPYLRRAVDSLLAQTLKEIEIVIVDDGSDDDTGTIAAGYAQAHPSRVIVVSKPNGGLSDARNAGVARSRGRYIGFVDADDTVEPEMFGHLYELAVRHRCEVAICRYVHEDADGGHATIGGVFPFAEGEVFGPEGFFLNSYVMMVCNKIYRRELVERFPQPTTWFEDVAWSPVVLSRVRRICSTPKVYYHYLRRPESIAESHRDPRTLQGIAALRYAIANAHKKYRDEVLYMAANRLRFEAKRRRLYADHYMVALHDLREQIGNSRCVLEDRGLHKRIARYLRDDFRCIPQVMVAAVLERERSAQERENALTWANPLCAPGSPIVTLGMADLPDTAVAAELQAAGRWPVLEDYLKLRYLHEHGGVAVSDAVVARKPIGWALHASECLFAFVDDQRISKAPFGAVAGHPWIRQLLDDFERLVENEDPLQAALDGFARQHDVRPSYSELEANFRARHLKLAHDTRIYASGVFCNDFGADLATTYLFPNGVRTADLGGASGYFREVHERLMADYLSWKQSRREAAAERPAEPAGTKAKPTPGLLRRSWRFLAGGRQSRR